MKQLENAGLRIPLCLEDISFSRASKTIQESIVIPNVQYQYPSSVSKIFAVDMDEIRVSLGKRVFILGENGAGKSTYLRLLCGDIKVSKKRFEPPNISKIYVPQDADLMLFCDSVADELLYGAREYGYDFDAKKMAEKLGLIDEFQQKMSPYELSRGQRLRLAIGAALSVRPDMLLLTFSSRFPSYLL